MAPMESESRKEGQMELQHIGHEHPLVLMHHQIVASEDEDERAGCGFGCGIPLEGWIYGCSECKFYLHKGCAELDLQPRLNHPFHPQHTLTFLPKSPYSCGEYVCSLCGGMFSGFVYHCATCQFDLDINCALLQSSMSANFPISLHPHPLLFIENHNDQVKYDCSGCMKSLSGPIYHCPDCSYPSHFNLHKECGELPLEMNHSYDRNHPLTLLPKLPTHPEKCSCYLCRTQWRGFVYSCSLCNFDLSIDDSFSPRTITHASHEHPWMLMLRKMSFICDFCGTAGDHSPYLCTICDLLVHKKCITLPRKIMLTRHHHLLSHSYYLQQNQVKDWTCRICYEEVDMRYGNYYCSTCDCDYIAHVHCATDPVIWDGTIFPEDYDESSMEALLESSNLITDVVEQIIIGEQMVASEIKHAYHVHNLTLTFRGEINNDSQCDGCMRPISTPFYSCDQCKFFLHKDCAELPRTMRHPFHKHLLTLTNSHAGDEYSYCSACGLKYQGFGYRCNKSFCKYEINFDIRCMLLSDTLKHPSHEHSLFLVHNFKGGCSGCGTELDSIAYRCMKRCAFTLDIGCATLPLTAWYKYEKHALNLTCFDDSDPSQLYCDLCENERWPNDWFYYCVDCDNSLHSSCALGDLPYMKLGNNLRSYYHRHSLTVVKNIWNCPPCKVCGELCNGQGLQCKEPPCNFSVHWGCCWELQ
ncbi:Pentatricopeptide repeat superfamily protein [Hibiscus syriacus]|uniref:Pentatricopeptide repeat superfamily protein n=2 Tax=Hibiscus syriacus TaxID=106335 RepID=A0A6A3AFY3_HIBSY|nr:Pentatricopeptide repeat superfamily protein [Hibiscus syriacus]